MLVEVHFKKGGIGSPHEHEGHEQISYVLSGSFEAIVGTEKKILRAGDGFVAEKNVLHGLTALEDSVVLDVFTPIRADFL
jgi:quercetin dioxygenase-like cupin family protein